MTVVKNMWHVDLHSCFHFVWVKKKKSTLMLLQLTLLLCSSMLGNVFVFLKTVGFLQEVSVIV